MTATRRPAGKADDKPFDFNLNAVRSEVDLTPWRVVWGPEDRRWTFTHMQELDAWELISAAGQGDLAATVAVFKAALGEEQYKEFRKIPLPQYKANKLFDAYAEHSGVDLGESQGSTG